MTHDRGLRHWRNISVAAGSFTSRLSNRCILSATPCYFGRQGVVLFFCALIQAPIIGSGEKGAAFDAIQDLLDDDLVSFKDEFEKSSFNVTFTFPADKKQSVKAFLDDAGKDQAVSIIVKAAEQWE